MHKWLLPTLSEILAQSELTGTETTGSSRETSGAGTHDGTQAPFQGSNIEPDTHLSGTQQRLKVEREWTGAIAALNVLLHQSGKGSHAEGSKLSTSSLRGLILSGPSSVLSGPELMANFSTWAFTAKPLNPLAWLPFQLLPAAKDQAVSLEETTPVLPLLPVDPLAAEQFCLALTPEFSLVIVLGENSTGKPVFQFSFDPAVIQQVWQALRPRIFLTGPHHVNGLEALWEQFSPVTPDYRVVMQFTQLLLQHLPIPVVDEARPKKVEARVIELEDEEPESRKTSSASLAAHFLPESSPHQDVELLQAIAHEVRTPLTTIRTLTRLLLKRQDLAPDVIKRLENIDRECSEQIDRFGLIFKVVELETSAVKQAAIPLTPTPLGQVFQQNIPRWQKQAQQRGLTLDVVLPQQMPTVVSDPTMLDQALTGLIERFTRSLPARSHIQVQVTLAGDQLKLQLESQPDPEHTCPSESTNPLMPSLKALGQLLMFQPETGNLSLNMTVTKNLFQALGGKLIVRQRPQQGEVLTIFLPLELNRKDIYTV